MGIFIAAWQKFGSCGKPASPMITLRSDPWPPLVLTTCRRATPSSRCACRPVASSGDAVPTVAFLRLKHRYDGATSHLVSLYRHARHLPPASVPLCVDYGLFLGGMVTADTLTGCRGLLSFTGRKPPKQNDKMNEWMNFQRLTVGFLWVMNHVYQNHGPAEGLAFVSKLQRLTTCVSLYTLVPALLQGRASA